MPFVQITWLPKACRTAAARKEVADAVIKVRAQKVTGFLMRPLILTLLLYAPGVLRLGNGFGERGGHQP